ncbi:molybdopterin-binding protein [Candidatus Deferrimicrobium sp.]|uniref:molybdopterin-binding protein n=1 Tax=Candidatus Deferrimicrobium sp. TaxID=3060586 RepID=UPI002EDA51CC
MSVTARRAGPSTITSAEILSIGSELTTGETRDTNGGDLARDLSARGVAVTRLVAVPDRRAAVTEALRSAIARADLVVTTGGLGPTPDDLTREAIADVVGEEPAVDPALASHLESLFERRGMSMPALNVKQAWLIPSAEALPNPHGSAPGWWVEVRPPRSRGNARQDDTRVRSAIIVALPGPPAEMWPMWRNEALPRLEAQGLGQGRVVRVLRLTGMGESQIVAALGEDLFRQPDPEVATYSRSEAVDIRVSAVGGNDRPATTLVDEVERRIMDTLGPHVFARGDEDWRAALGTALAGRTLATVEAATGGRLVALLGGSPWLVHAEVARAARLSDLAALARTAREIHGADVGLALRAAPRKGDTVATVAVDDARRGTWRESRVVFLGGEQGQRRAALAACAILFAGLRDRTAPPERAGPPREDDRRVS